MKAKSLYHQKWRTQLNQKAYEAAQFRRREKRYQLLYALKDRPCFDCHGWFDNWQMEFDHREDKKFNITRGFTKPIKELLEELKKCDVVCANCHRTRTHKRHQQGVNRKWVYVTNIVN